MMRPTPKAVLFFGFSIPVALLIVAGWREGWYFSLYIPFITLAFIGADMMMALPNRRLQTKIQSPNQLYIGQRGFIKVDLFAEGHPKPLIIQALL